MAEAVPLFDDGDSGLRGGDSGCPVAPAGHAARGPTTDFGFVQGNGPDVAVDGGIAIQLGKGTENTEMSVCPVTHCPLLLQRAAHGTSGPARLPSAKGCHFPS